MRKSHRKEIFATITSMLSTAVLLLTIGKALGGLRILVAALSGVVVCLYVIYRKVPSELEPLTRLPLFPRWGRRTALAVLVISIAVLAFSPMYLVPGPSIERLVPIDPVAGGKLQLFGHNLPAESALTMRIGRDSVSEISVATPDYLEVRVPENATSGPIVVTRKRRLLPDQRAVYPVTSVQNLTQDVVLLTEDIRENGAGQAILFSILNTTKQRTITINDVRLETVLVQDLSGPPYQQERIDLGIYSMLEDHTHGAILDLLRQESIRLTDGTYTVKLPPMSSASFRFELRSPPTQHHIKLVFVIVIGFFDDTGASARAYSNRLFAFEMSDIFGISASESLPLNRSSIDILEQKYDTAVRNFGWDR